MAVAAPTTVSGRTPAGTSELTSAHVLKRWAGLSSKGARVFEASNINKLGNGLVGVGALAPDTDHLR